MTKIEIAKKIIEQCGCSGIRCLLCPLWDFQESCGANLTERQRVQLAKEYLSKNKKPIIGWPGNVEEMRQYEGQEMEFSDSYGFENPSHGYMQLCEKYHSYPYKRLPERHNISEFGRYPFCRPIPRPAFPELTLSEIADKFGIPLDQLRIKDGPK